MREKVLFSSLTIQTVVSSDYATYGTDDAGKNQLSDKVRRNMIYIIQRAECEIRRWMGSI